MTTDARKRQNAEAARRYRERIRAEGKKPKSGPSGGKETNAERQRRFREKKKLQGERGEA